MVFTLSGCQEKPFDSDIDGYEYTVSDELVFNFDNGSGSTELFKFLFDEELKMFVNDDKTIYNFKNINDYTVASAQIEKLITMYEDTIKYRTYVLTDVDEVIKLSAGATEDDYNLVDVSHDGEVVSEDAFITTENGVSLIVSYTKFIIDGEDVYVPAYIQLFVDTIHLETSWDYLGSDNEYSDDPMKVITYELIVVPLPAKTGALSSYEELESSGTTLDDFSRAVNTGDNIVGTWLPCSNGEYEGCIFPISTTLEIQAYETTQNDVMVFYEENFGARYNDGNFTFFSNGQAFVLYDIQEVQVRDDNDEIINVVNAKIRLY